MDAPFIIHSVEHQAALELTLHDADYFMAEVRSRGLQATTRVCSYMFNGFSEMFGEFAENWKGWSGERRWSSLEGELEIRAHSDQMGHVFLIVRLRKGAPALWTVEAHLKLEAGQLDELARKACSFEAAILRDT